jgi:hypothetical protein
MLKGKIVNTIRIIAKPNSSIKKIIDYIQSDKKIIDYKNIIPLENVDNEDTKIEMWEQPSNAQIDSFKILDNEILIKLRTPLSPPLKIVKHLSLFSEIEEIVLSYANLNMKSESGLFYIRRGGIVYTAVFEENSPETMEFSSKLIHQLVAIDETTIRKEH